jgi:hypothetical protein
MGARPHLGKNGTARSFRLAHSGERVCSKLVLFA